MKKPFIVLILIALVTTVSLFAGSETTADASLTLSAEILGINMMKLTASPFTPETPSIDLFNGAADNENLEEISSAEEVADIAWLSILTNRRTGFSIYVSATPLVNADKNYEIDYKISMNETFTYASKPTSLPFVEIKPGITGLSAFSYPISIDINDDQYAAALEGTYTGTVTFTYKAN
ncbi:hypothetical protein SpiGrapes_1377 [Sphaerochaeta pleomorpha str. Grapes]|uniref:Uncharacterized protein n=1 Tax=Sphaerochaeta pleomorpha (strain ATCC BAA-1885 / DSM 22778 / Grapes) TaxID=158190 RepID=G8QUF6_SPHPG|nr:hypothetical protein [Sphaerochaeta pleomorpha]AEV29189.1 hypothetical protein SpiGrapes_1377 [Sphaerochaeta pleomorpha str. Grapes]